MVVGWELEHAQRLDALLQERRIITGWGPRSEVVPSYAHVVQILDLEGALRAAGIHPASITDLTEVGDGWECRVFRVSRAEVEDVALRLYTGDPSGHTMQAEIAAYLALQDVDFPAPRLLAQHSSTEPLGAPFVLIDWLDGPLAYPLGASPESLAMLTGLLVRLHDIEPNPDRTARYQIPIRTNRDVMERRRAWLDEANLEGFRPPLEWLTGQLASVEEVPLSYVHMDFHPKNVILTTQGPVVFDWGSFAVADPRADLSWTLLLAEAYLGEESVAQILSVYERRRPEGIDGLPFFDVSSVWRRFTDIVTMLREDLPSGVRDQVLDAIRRLEPAYRRLTEITGTVVPEVEALYQ